MEKGLTYKKKLVLGLKEIHGSDHSNKRDQGSKYTI